MKIESKLINFGDELYLYIIHFVEAHLVRFHIKLEYTSWRVTR